jgi:hypothetical protein
MPELFFPGSQSIRRTLPPVLCETANDADSMSRLHSSRDMPGGKEISKPNGNFKQEICLGSELEMNKNCARMKSKPFIPFSFVLENLYPREPRIKPMFGCFGVYLDEKIVFILRKRKEHLNDNGVWLATSKQYHSELHNSFPSMRSIGVLGNGETNWQIIPEDASTFESDVLHLCELVRKGDKRIGKIPGRKKEQHAKNKFS